MMDTRDDYEGDSSRMYGKCMDSSECLGGDSGFLSGSCTTESDMGLSSTDLGQSSTDLGQSSISASYNRLDSGVDVSESMSGLNISTHSMDLKQEMNTLKEMDFPSWEHFFMPDEDGDTQLHIGVMEGFEEGVFSLISLVPHPSILDFQNDACQTALHLAVLTKQAKIVRRLVAAGARVDMRDRFGNTPLHLAAASGDLLSVQALTLALSSAECNTCRLVYPPFAQPLPQQINSFNYEGQAPIHLAALSGHCDVIRALHWLKADLNEAEGKAGRSPLHLAVERGHSAAVRVLVSECGVSIESRTYAGYTPIDLAADPESTLAQNLISLGARRSSLNSDSEDSDSDGEEL